MDIKSVLKPSSLKKIDEYYSIMNILFLDLKNRSFANKNIVISFLDFIWKKFQKTEKEKKYCKNHNTCPAKVSFLCINKFYQF